MKYRFDTIIGTAVLFLFVCVLCTVGVSRWIAANETRKSLDDLSKNVANNDKKSLMDWASGNFKDQWGNTFVLDSNGDEVKFLSKGPDGILGSKDDIFGNSWTKKKIVYYSVVVVKEQVKPDSSLWQGTLDKVKRWRGK